MAGAPAPQVLFEAIAADAGPTFITTPMPEAPTGTLAASIQGGFPPITMTNTLAGGKPPLGQDENGFLFLLSGHTFWVECGQPYPFNAELAAAIGGYVRGAIVRSSDGFSVWYSLVDGNTIDPDSGANTGAWVPNINEGLSTLTGLTGGTSTLGPGAWRSSFIILRGALTSNLAINLPNLSGKEWLIINATSGAFTTTVKTAAGGSTGVTAPQGGNGAPLGVYTVGDGNVYPTVAPLSVPIDQGPTPLTLVERTNAGYVLATYFNQNSALENATAVGSVFVQNTAVDGFLRKIGLTSFEAQILLQGLAGQVTNGQVPFSVISQWAAALFANAALTGVPTTPTAAAGTSNTQVASTAFANPGVIVTGNGICIPFPNGYKLQAGTVNPAGGSALATFPVPFTSSVFPVAISIASGGVQTWLGAAPTLANMSVHNSGGSSIWIAVGI